MTDRFICGCCGEPKFSLEPRKSKVTGMDLLMCKTCIDRGYEPRYLLIIAFKQGEAMRKRALPYINGNKYCGEPIQLKETL